MREDLFNELCDSAKEAGEIAKILDWKKWYPLLAKHNAPVKEIADTLRGHPIDYWRVPFDDLNPWVATLPKDWPEMFSNVMGQVTCDGLGLYLEDVEATLYALERGWSYRGDC